jgi:hypothetical protein
MADPDKRHPPVDPRRRCGQSFGCAGVCRQVIGNSKSHTQPKKVLTKNHIWRIVRHTVVAVFSPCPCLTAHCGLLKGEKIMETAYSDMSAIKLTALLTNTQNKIDDKEDERDLILGQSQSGQHISSKYIQSHCERIEQDIKSLKTIVEEVEREMENRKAKE